MAQLAKEEKKFVINENRVISAKNVIAQKTRVHRNIFLWSTKINLLEQKTFISFLRVDTFSMHYIFNRLSKYFAKKKKKRFQ